MKPIIIINTFKTIIFHESKKPIVICDIDHTFIRPKSDYSECYKKLNSKHYHHVKLHKMVLYMLKYSMNKGLVKQTDKEGFTLLLERIEKLGGKLIFLTARSSIAHEKTINDLISVGLQNPQQFDIFYTGNQIDKGDYIKKYNLLAGYDHPIFIDDCPHFLDSASRIFPEMDCYLFTYKR